MIYRRYKNTGMVHGQDAYGRTMEACNLDEAGPFEIITEDEFAAVPVDKLCKREFRAVVEPVEEYGQREDSDG